jgi:hypothetical protein
MCRSIVKRLAAPGRESGAIFFFLSFFKILCQFFFSFFFFFFFFFFLLASKLTGRRKKMSAEDEGGGEGFLSWIDPWATSGADADDDASASDNGGGKRCVIGCCFETGCVGIIVVGGAMFLA